MLIFEFRNREFAQVKGTPSTDVYLQINKEIGTLELCVGKGSNLIETRTAERQARSISVSGVQCSNGERIGVGYQLSVNSDNSDGGLPDRLKKPVTEAYGQRRY